MKLVFIALALMVVVSCKENRDVAEVNTVWRTSIHANPQESDLPYVSILDSAWILPLEFTEESILKRIHKVRICKGTVVVLDELLKNIFLYDLSGAFIRKFSAFGKGPGEMIDILDMEVDQDEELILLQSSGSKSINRYHLSDLSFKDQLTPDLFPGSFTINPEMD